MNFPFDTFLVILSGPSFLFHICKIQNFIFSIEIEQQHDVVRKLLRRIQNIRILCNES